MPSGATETTQQPVRATAGTAIAASRFERSGCRRMPEHRIEEPARRHRNRVPHGATCGTDGAPMGGWRAACWSRAVPSAEAHDRRHAGRRNRRRPCASSRSLRRCSAVTACRSRTAKARRDGRTCWTGTRTRCASEMALERAVGEPRERSADQRADPVTRHEIDDAPLVEPGQAADALRTRDGVGIDDLLERPVADRA